MSDVDLGKLVKVYPGSKEYGRVTLLLRLMTVLAKYRFREVIVSLN